MLTKTLVVAFGGSLGAVLRYLLYELIEKSYHSDFPWATLTVNLLGSLVIGFLWGYFARTYVSPAIRLMVFVGILGSFTTFSTFAFDNFSLLKDGNFTLMAAYLLISNFVAIFLCIGGYQLSKMIG